MRRIEFIETLGRGGFGAVYLADVHGRDDFVQRLAVKVLSADMNELADVAARQRDEARLLARLNHDHIVRVIDLTEVAGRPAVLMEYVEGADGALLLKRGPIPARAAVQIAMAAASALDAAWSTEGRNGRPLRVVHRDIKPANLLVSRHGGVKVLDFGVARADFDREGQTGSVQFGTARFMAPEQWLYGQASHKVDVFALGVTLVELLTSMHLERAPLQIDAFQAHMAAVRAAVRAPEWPSAFADGVDGLLALMLAFEPDHRPDAGECYEILVELADIAPGASLRRWAAEAVPPAVEARRARWADEPPPVALVAPDPPAPVRPDETLSTARPATQALGETPPATPGPAAADRSAAQRSRPSGTVPLSPASLPEIPDTLATPRPGRASGALPRVAAVAAAATVLGLGLAVAVPALLPGEPAVPAVAGEGAVVDPLASGGTAGGTAADAEVTSGDGTDADPTAADPTVADPAAAGGPMQPPVDGGVAAGGSPASGPVATAAVTERAATTSREGESGEGGPAPAQEGAPRGQGGTASAEPSPTASTSRAGGGTSSGPPTPAGAGPMPQPAAALAAPTDAAPPVTVATAPTVATVPVSLSSTPWGARVEVDGSYVGTTPLTNLPLTAGSHRVRLELDGRSVEKTITVGGRNPTRHTWTVETDTWRSSL